MTDDSDTEDGTHAPTDVDRRRFLRATGLAGAGGVTAIAGCAGGGGGEGEGTDGTGETTDDGTPTDTVDPDDIREGGTLVWGHSEVTQNLDIHQTATASTGRFLNSVYDSLVGLTRDLELSTDPNVASAGLASDWEVGDDLTTYTFTLREGVTFHDGTELTAEDVKYSYDRIADPDTGAIMQFVFGSTESVEVEDDYTVVINQSEVYQPLLRQLAFSGTSIVPADSGDRLGEEPVGTGPFRFVTRQQGNRAELEAFDDYWADGPYLDAVEERTVTDPDSRLTGIQEGSYDLINDIPLDDIDDVTDDGSDDVETRTWSPLSWAFLNMNNDEPPFDDADFRKAVDFCIDKGALVEGALFGNGEPTASPSFPASAFRNEEISPREQDFDRAAELFEQSDYAVDEFDLTFKVTTNYPWHVDAATIMQQFFQQAGLSVEIQQLQWSDWLSQVFANRDFTLSMVNFFTFWEPAYLYTSLWTSDGSFNFRGYASDEYDRAVADAAQASGREEAVPLYREAQSIIHEDVPDVMLWFRDGTLAAKDTVRGLDTILSPNNSELDFGRVWMDQP
ncbi:ABC transporter substrate-binding protein [Halobacteriales archaeon QS_6_71_20]|nr:MAG: ABC transporter substrate-binding protein [Halobacteriales archaeon QS_6_71_20]